MTDLIIAIMLNAILAIIFNCAWIYNIQHSKALKANRVKVLIFVLAYNLLFIYTFVYIKFIDYLITL